MGIQAHQHGHRSPELVALLANTHYQIATEPDDYRTALNYYSTLPSPIRDPGLLMNKALTLGGLGEYKRAHEVLDRLSGYTLSEPTRNRLRVTRVRLDLQQGDYRRALKRIESIPNNRRTLEVRTLRAQCLIGLGEPKKARLELKQILRREAAPYQAEILYNNLRDENQEIRS
jgi:tetratricopeptide (TPR) repeat protein